MNISNYPIQLFSIFFNCFLKFYNKKLAERPSPPIFYFILNIAFVIPTKNFGSFITTTFIILLLHSKQRAAQYYNQGTLNYGKEPHRQYQCRKNPRYVCKGKQSARSANFFLQKWAPPFNTIVRKRVIFCYFSQEVFP